MLCVCLPIMLFVVYVRYDFFQISYNDCFSDKKQKIAIARKLCLESLEKEKAAIENEYSAKLKALKEDLEKIDYSKVKKLVCKIYHKSGTIVTLNLHLHISLNMS